MNGNDINKTDIKSLFESAMKLYQLPEQQNEAKKVFRQITEIPIDYDNVDELYYKGMSHFYSGWEITKAIQCFKKILKIGTADTEFLFNIGIYLYKNGYPTRGLVCFDKVLNSTNDICGLFNKAAILTSLKHNSIVSEYYNKILSLTENHNNSQIEKYYIGLSAYYLLRDPIANKYFKEVAEEEIQDLKILFNTSIKLCELKDYEVAYKCLQKSLNLGDNNIAILCDSTKLFYFLNKPNETEECIDKILELQTDDLINLYDLAEFLNSNRNSSATKLYEKISSIEKPDCRTQESYIKAVCKIILKDRNAVKHFKDVLKYELKDINHIFWLNGIAHRLLSIKQYDLARSCFQKILKLNDTSNDKDANILIMKAVALKALGRKQDAIDALKKF